MRDTLTINGSDICVFGMVSKIQGGETDSANSYLSVCCRGNRLDCCMSQRWDDFSHHCWTLEENK